MGNGKYLLLLVPAVFGICACEKEIDIDYREAEKLYVVEAAVTSEYTRVLITRTQAMSDNMRQRSIEGAKVVITSGDSIRSTVPYNRNGYYLSALKGQPGVRYAIDIEVEGRHFSAESTMQPMPQLSSMRFVWKKILNTEVLYADLRISDLPGRADYYFIHLYRNGLGYRWAVLTDKQQPGGELQQLITCMTRSDIEKGTDDSLNEGDRLRILVRSIDRASYDYLYSMQLMDNTMTNPITYFTGGCLGYFSAYSQAAYDRTFSTEGIERE